MNTDESPGQSNDWKNQAADFWSNSTYFVTARHNHCGEIRLISIRRHDWQPCSDWRDKQEIKNQIVGAEWEAVEVYPAESRVLDLGNWAHLFVMPNGERFPLGFVGEASRSDKPVTANEVQRPLAQRGDTEPLIHIYHLTKDQLKDSRARQLK